MSKNHVYLLLFILQFQSSNSKSSSQLISSKYDNESFLSVFNGVSFVNCSFDHKCLPSFLIAGAQKSGTTALAAHLSGHQRISLASRKEVHFFDKTAAHNKGVSEYLKAFYSWNASERDLPPLFGEATPFYIASRVACRRIANTVPDVKMIILLRNPVARAYSEYQMKKRRVDQQIQFFKIITQHEQKLLQCMRSHPNNLTAVKGCVPEELGLHPRWIKLKTALVKLQAKMPLQNWAVVLDMCFPVKKDLNKEVDHTLSLSNHGCFDNCMDDNTLWEQLDVQFPPSSSIVRRMNPIKPLSTSGPHRQVRNKSSRRVMYNFAQYDSQRVVCSTPRIAINTSSVIRHYSPFPHERIIEQRTFDFKACWRYCPEGYEELPSVDSAFREEIEAFTTCGGEALRKVVEKYDQHNSTEAISQDDFESHLDVLNSVVDRCLLVRSGISSQYFYRSLYVVQLAHCFKSLPADQFLIVPTERLRHRPQVVLKEVFTHIGLSRNDTVTSVSLDGLSQDGSTTIDTSQEGLASAISKHFPVFEKTTGWRLDSGYEAMSEDLSVYLEGFFRPYNSMLFRLLNQSEIQYEW